MKTIYQTCAWILFLCMANSCSDTGETVEKAKTLPDNKFYLRDHFKKGTAILTVSEQPIKEQLTLSGTITYNENDLVVFRSLLEGVVDEVHFELGDVVRKGQVLASIKSMQIQELYQQKRSLQNQIVLSDKQVQIKQELFHDGLIAEPELLETRHTLEQAKIELDRIQESLKLYRAVGNGSFQILAPKDGYIIQKNISSGQSIAVMDSDPLFSISNLKEVWVMVNIYASNLRYIHQGDRVQVRTIAYPDKSYDGRIDKIYNVFDDNEHVLKARVILENPQLQLMPGLAADIIIDKETSANRAFAIPNKALVFSNNKNYIVTYRNDSSMRIQQVTPIAANDSYTYIQERLNPEEKVIGSNALLIFEQLNP